jgi:glycosyltransferase involved in cell wall biosynthesis
VQTIKNLSPDIVDTLENYTLSSYLVTSQRYTLKAKTVVTSWENVVMPFHRFVMRYLVNLKTNKFRALTNSAKLRLIKEKVSEEKISVIPPAINVKKFSPGTSDLREKLNLKDKRIILYVGRLIKQKGVIELILAMKLVKKVISDATLLLVGGGPLEETVKKLSTDLNLEESIRLYGPVPHESMPEVYRVADVLVLPSIVTKTWMEQFGYVLAEAMATGIPVVASNCGAIPELVKHEETGLLTKPGDPIDLAQRIIEILKNDELKQKVRENGMKYVRKYYSLEEVVPKLDNFYLTLVQAKR